MARYSVVVESTTEYGPFIVEAKNDKEAEEKALDALAGSAESFQIVDQPPRVWLTTAEGSDSYPDAG